MFTRSVECAFAGALVVLASSCSGLVLEPYPETPPDALGNVVVSSDLAAAATRVDAEISDAHFGLDLAEARVVPVFLSLENRGTATSLVIVPEDITLDGDAALRNGTQLQEEIAALEWAEFKSNAGAAGMGLGILFLPLWPFGLWLTLSGTSSYSHAMEVRHALVVNEFHAATLAPGMRAQGVLYFDAEAVDGEARSGTKTLRVAAIRAEDGTRLHIELPIHSGDTRP